MAKKLIGLASIRMGSLSSDGSMGTALTQVGATVSDTAAITTEEGTNTDFGIEESDSPFYSFESAPGKLIMNWSTYDVSLATAARFFGGSVAAAVTAVLTTSTLVGGSSYVNGTYYNVPLTGGTGSGARATVVVASGAVTSVTITYGGTGYTASDSLSASNIHLGGAGSGFTIVAATVGAGRSAWGLPDTLPAIERSIEIITKDGWIILIPRMSIVAKLQWNFKKTALAQIDIVGTILDPEVGDRATAIEPAA
jgi:hypothetical protein